MTICFIETSAENFHRNVYKIALIIPVMQYHGAQNEHLSSASFTYTVAYLEIIVRGNAREAWKKSHSHQHSRMINESIIEEGHISRTSCRICVSLLDRSER